LVQLTTEYSLDHEVVSTLPQLYQVTLIETDGEYKISQLTKRKNFQTILAKIKEIHLYVTSNFI
ncbi:MAG: hypothetical protein ABS881_05020, partial [Psychrobacter alimentarius]